jgi:prepilin-type N-terminal cleavage/methylation domain-containing protein
VRRRGFTLLETLIALAIGALILAALHGAIMGAAAARERTAERAERTAAGRTVLLGIARELEAASPARAWTVPGSEEPAMPALLPLDRFVAVSAPHGGPPWSELRFATVAGGDLRLVAYRIEPAGRLVRRAVSRFAAPDAAEPPGVPALGGVRLFRVRCFDGRAWRSAWTAPGLPRAVELALGIDDGAGGVVELATTVALPLGAS